jgi:hypothetical protein
MPSSWSDDLYLECHRILVVTGPADKPAQRSGVAGASLESLLVWNVLIAGILHLCIGLVTHAVWDRMRETHHRLRNGDPTAIEAAKPLVKEVGEIVAGLDSDPKFIPAKEAKLAVASILAEQGWAPSVAEEKAEEVVKELSKGILEAHGGGRRSSSAGD